MKRTIAIIAAALAVQLITACSSTKQCCPGPVEKTGKTYVPTGK